MSCEKVNVHAPTSYKLIFECSVMRINSTSEVFLGWTGSVFNNCDIRMSSFVDVWDGNPNDPVQNFLYFGWNSSQSLFSHCSVETVKYEILASNCGRCSYHQLYHCHLYWCTNQWWHEQFHWWNPCLWTLHWKQLTLFSSIRECWAWLSIVANSYCRYFTSYFCTNGRSYSVPLVTTQKTQDI